MSVGDLLSAYRYLGLNSNSAVCIASTVLLNALQSKSLDSGTVPVETLRLDTVASVGDFGSILSLIRDITYMN